jgi:hypothetical protein
MQNQGDNKMKKKHYKSYYAARDYMDACEKAEIELTFNLMKKKKRK